MFNSLKFLSAVTVGSCRSRGLAGHMALPMCSYCSSHRKPAEVWGISRLPDGPIAPTSGHGTPGSAQGVSPIGQDGAGGCSYIK